MSRDENVMSAYRHGRDEERIDAYLENPGMRERFDEIDREEESAASPATAGTRRKGGDWFVCRFCTPSPRTGHP